jgi:Nitrile hydratase beta subunit
LDAVTQLPPETLPIPRDDAGSPVFEEPWQAQATGDPDLGDTYYTHWLAALERILTDKRLLEATELASRKEQWAEAARDTPHGMPIELRRPTS